MERDRLISHLPQLLIGIWIVWAFFLKPLLARISQPASSPQPGVEEPSPQLPPQPTSAQVESTTEGNPGNPDSANPSIPTIKKTPARPKVDPATSEVLKRRNAAIRAPLPHYMKSALWEFERSYKGGGYSNFQEFSPLTCYGYRVGVSRGLPEKKRHEIIFHTWHAAMPKLLPKSYTKEWGKAGTSKRYDKILSHIKMLAKQRAHRASFEVAVNHWSSDADWLTRHYGQLAKDYESIGF